MVKGKKFTFKEIFASPNLFIGYRIVRSLFVAFPNSAVISLKERRY